MVGVSEDAGRAASTGDYPRTHHEFRTMFPDLDACRAYLEGLRWPQTFVCANCNASEQAWRHSRRRLVCPSCRFQTTATAGTILDKTRTPLERTLGVSYLTAWTMLHRFRVAMVRSERSPLRGEVEVDETFVGGEETGGKRGRGSDKEIVLVAVEVRQPRGFGRVRLGRVMGASSEQLLPFVRAAVEPGSEVHTDGWGGYNRLSEHGLTHRVTNLSASGDPAHVAMPAVHRVASLLKRWILGTHQGSVSGHHLQAYLEEFTFRFNRRTSRSRGLVFRRLLEQAVPGFRVCGHGGPS